MPGFGSPLSVAQQFPLKVILGSDDITPYIAEGMTFSNVDPGGYEAASFQIPKDLPNTLRGMPIRIDSGLGVAWEGRVQQIQRSLGSETTVTGQGYGAVLTDDVAAMIFVDRDLTYWQGPTVNRQIALVTAGYSPASGQIAADPVSGNPAIVLAATGPWAAGGYPDIESLYDGQGIPIYAIYYSLDFDANATAAGISAVLAVAQDDITTGVTYSTTYTANASGLFLAGVGENQPYGYLIAYAPATPGGSSNVVYGVYVTDLAVYGWHGLPTQGGPPNGFFPSQIVGWALEQTGSLQPGTMPQTDATGYVIPHSVYYTPTTLAQIVGDMATAAGWHWGVWESPAPLTGNALPRLDFTPRPTQGQFAAFCHRSDCDKCDIKEDIMGMYNQVVITYTDVDGTSRAVTAQADNPVLDVTGISRTAVLNGGTMTAADAEVFGEMALDLLYNQARVSGTVEISGTIDGLSGPMAPWMLKAGLNRLRIGDLPSVDAWGALSDVPISRVETSASSKGVTTTIEVGSGGDLVETLQSRLAAAGTLAAQGGV